MNIFLPTALLFNACVAINSLNLQTR